MPAMVQSGSYAISNSSPTTPLLSYTLTTHWIYFKYTSETSETTFTEPAHNFIENLELEMNNQIIFDLYLMLANKSSPLCASVYVLLFYYLYGKQNWSLLDGILHWQQTNKAYYSNGVAGFW